ncbi:inositol 2-dehydrogenase [Lichenicola cladoniae]|uniref:Inositol 2-dehydrogenase n=1 Tax=Lichenicola cladoniae TaxID=1484109 RepID=A0A6M8HU30_9PROT|nr:inositol 2-dehydrogenase [Lichenicola cladoniae]NPD66146.1 inositol 2-dehydrogenase [Acetobacteraceae bacterium]QKE92013.1 inositol 2-dehydrogenase [Lichenicola cladoniae]
MVRFTVLGCGRIGRMHAANLARHPGVELVSVFDIMDEAANATAQALGVRRAASTAEALSDPKVDAVLIATPTATHVPLIIEAARAGKAILCEKPIDLDIERVLQCRDEIAGFDPIVMIGFNRRFDPTFAALRRRVEAGEIGRVEQVVISSRDPAPPPLSYIRGSGGLFHDMMIHDFDMARSLVGDIVEVSALGAVLVDPGIGEAGDIDAAMVTLRAASGALVHINNSRRCAYGYDQRLEVFGEKGMLLAGNQRETTVEAHLADRTACRDPILHFFIQRYTDAYAAEISHFVTAVETHTRPTPGFSDGLEALRLADAAATSHSTGRSVRLDQVAGEALDSMMR